MREVALYIAGQKVDIDEKTFILFNYTFEDLSNPAIVRNPYSKTIKVQGTQNNNKIFGHAFRLDCDSEKSSFNILHRTQFSIYDGLGCLLQSGYVKLNNIIRERDNISYEITLYGELGNFLYGLSYIEDGEKANLSHLHYGVDSVGNDDAFLFPITKESIVSAWERLADNESAMNSIWDYINFVPCLNGLPNNLSANKAYLQEQDFTLVELARNFNEWEVRDLRSQFQTPAISTKAIFQGILNWASEHGYRMLLDDTFFNEDNPYYNKTWYLLSQFATMEYQKASQLPSGKIQTSISTPCYEGIPSAFTAQVNGDITTDSSGKIDLSSYDKMAYLEGDIAVQLQANNSGFLAYYNQKDGKIYGTSLGVQVSIVKGVNESVQYSKVFLFGAWDTNDSKVQNVLANFGNREYQYVGNTIESSALFHIKAYCQGASDARIKVTYYAVTDKDGLGNNKFDFYVTENAPTKPEFTQGEVRVKAFGGDLHLKVPESAEAGGVVTKSVLLSNTPSPADFLLSYCKQFGLTLAIDGKDVTVMPRNNFFSGEIEDISEYIDRESMTITPLTFDKRWFLLGHPHSETYYDKVYKNTYDKNFGEMRLDTGYPFNNESQEMMSSLVLKGAISVRDGGMQYYRYYNNGKEVNPALIFGYTDEQGERVDGGYSNRTPILSEYPGYDSVVKLCGYSKDEMKGRM